MQTYPLKDTDCWITTSRHKKPLRVIYSADKVKAGHKPVNNENEQNHAQYQLSVIHKKWYENKSTI